MTSHRRHPLPVISIPICLITAVSLLSTISAQAPKSDGELRVQTLIRQLEDSNPGVCGPAAYELGQIGPAAVAAAPALIETFTHKDGYVRGSAAEALRKIGLVAVPALIEALKNKHLGVRGGAAYVLGQIGPEARAAVPALIQTLEDTDEYVRGTAADALAKIGPVAVKELIAVLHDTNPSVHVRGGAAYVLGQIGPEAEAAIPALIEVLKDQHGHVYVRSVAADAIGRIRLGAESAIPELTKALHDPNGEVRSGAAYALSEIGPEARAAIPTLIEALNAQHEHVRGSAANALMKIGPVAVPALIEALKNEHSEVGVRGGAAYVLGQIGPEAQAAVPALIEALEDKGVSARRRGVYVHRQAASALGRMGPEGRAAFPALVEAVRAENMDKDVRVRSAAALSGITTALTQTQAKEIRSQLELALQATQSSAEPEVRKHADPIRRKIEEIGQPWSVVINTWVRENLYLFLIITGIFLIITTYLVLLLIRLYLLWRRPLSLLRVSQRLSFLKDIKLPDWLGGFTIPLRDILFVDFFHYHPRVLDSWISEHVGSAVKVFADRDTVKEREIHVPVPVELDEESKHDLSIKDLWPTFSKERSYLVIWGEGGLGKTSLACRLGKSAMAEKKEERLCAEHRMLPLLIEPKTSKASGDSLPKIIDRQVNALTGTREPAPPEFVNNLLKRRRLLVIADSFSELSEALGEQILTSIADTSINACIVTSRNDESLEGQPKTTVKPQRIRGDGLATFMSAYLTQRRKGEQFDDEDFFDACRRLSLMVGNRNVTALLAKIYADLMIASQEAASTDALPENIPDLMLSYLNYLNRGAAAGGPDNRTVHRAAQAIAWECLKQKYRPMPANYDDALAALGGGEKATQLIKHLEGKLKIIKTDFGDNLRFVLDPVSEYMAGIYLVNRHGPDERSWREFLERADEQEGAPATIMGFLLAVRDCSLTKGADAKVPNFVAAELTKRIVKQLIKYLKDSSAPDDRVDAAKDLGAFGSAAKEAAIALSDAVLRDPNAKVKKAAFSAFVKLKLEAKDAVSIFAQALTGTDPNVLRIAAAAIQSIESGAKDISL